MSETDTRYIQMPPNGTYPKGHKLPLKDRVLVVVGANGSGKTRLGVWLDQNGAEICHRVSAHRALSLPPSYRPQAIKAAETLFLGYQASQVGKNPAIGLKPSVKKAGRWKSDPAIGLHDDYVTLVHLLCSQSFDISEEYRKKMQTASSLERPPKTRFEIAKQIWEEILPARELLIGTDKIEAKNRRNGVAYRASQMSDGERGVFYLIGEALCVPKHGVFIVDEPELHLHQAIQSRLWNAIEAARPDCIFVYITHDLNFAASRKDATKVWLREYTDGKWEWEVVPESDEFPESMLLEVMGSRQPILFVEGDRGSLDYFIYGRLFPDHCVMPCGSCEIVIHSTNSFAQLAELHHNTCHGLIDNDGRDQGDIDMLKRLNVDVLPVAQVECLFLLEPMLRIAAEKLGRDPTETVSAVKARVFNYLTNNRVSIVSNLTRQEIEAKLRLIGRMGDGVDVLAAAYTSVCAGIDPKTIYTRWDAEVARVISENDYSSALRYCKGHGIVAQAADPVFGIKPYKEQVKRWLHCKDAEVFLVALRKALPFVTTDGKWQGINN